MDQNSGSKKIITIPASIAFIICGCVLVNQNWDLLAPYGVDQVAEWEKRYEDHKSALKVGLFFKLPANPQVQNEISTEPPKAGRIGYKLKVENGIAVNENETLVDMTDEFQLLQTSHNSVALKKMDKTVVWEFSFAQDNVRIGSVSRFDNQVLLNLNNNSIASIEYTTGQLIWHRKYNGVSKIAVLRNNQVLIAKVNDDAKGLEAFDSIALLDIADGKILNHSPSIGFLPDNTLLKVITSDASGLTLIGYTNKSQIYIWDTNTKDSIKKASLSAHGQFRNPVASKNAIYFTTDTQKLVKVDLATLEVAWSTPMRYQTDEQLATTPNPPRVITVSPSGYMQVFNSATGESEWRLNLQNKNTLRSPLTLQLDNASINKLELPWRYAGWIIAAPCASGRLCLIDPKEGRTIYSVNLQVDDIISRPKVINSALWVKGSLPSTQGSDSEPSQIKLLKFVDN